MAQARGGNNALSELGKTVQRLDLKPWPGRVVEVYLGTAEPETVLSVAKDPDPQKDKNQLCEAYFYLAERALLAGNRDAAVGLLQQALQTEATQETVSYAAAKEELRRLNAQPKP